MTGSSFAQYGAPAYENTDPVDVFGRSLTPVPVTPLDADETWICFGCAGLVPMNLEPDITVVFKTFVVQFCSDGCADFSPGFPRAAELHKARYRDVGQYRITLVGEDREGTLDDVDARAPLIRLVDPTSEYDRENFLDVIEAEYRRPELQLLAFKGESSR